MTEIDNKTYYARKKGEERVVTYDPMLLRLSKCHINVCLVTRK
jgi:hypothetical protein